MFRLLPADQQHSRDVLDQHVMSRRVAACSFHFSNINLLTGLYKSPCDSLRLLLSFISPLSCCPLPRPLLPAPSRPRHPLVLTILLSSLYFSIPRQTANRSV